MIPPGGNELVKADLAIQRPTGCYGRSAPHSGLTLHHRINVGGGVVDEDYRGNLCIILFNHSYKPFHISRGDGVAQLICQKIYYPDLEEVKELDDTERSTKGFGSTGHN